MFRWYDYWLKGIDTGIMDDNDAPIRVFVEGSRRWRAEKQWPLARTAWTRYFLRPRHRLAATPEPLGADAAPPDGFYQAPFTVTSDVQSLKWTTAPLLADTEMTGPAALYVHVAIDTDDTNLIAKLYDVDAQGNRQSSARAPSRRPIANSMLRSRNHGGRIIRTPARCRCRRAR